MRDLTELSATQLEQEAQRAAEARLAYCGELLYADENPDQSIRAPGEDEEPCGPYDGCDTCIVREVLDAAWFAILELAKREIDGAAHRCAGCHRDLPQNFDGDFCVRCARPLLPVTP
jgi:hypothetical protein